MAILHHELPQDMQVRRALPGVQPVEGPWLQVDAQYGRQMALRDTLLSTQRGDVLACPPDALAPAQELLDMILPLLGEVGFDVQGDVIHCPDGRRVTVQRADPLGSLGRLVPCDLCLLHKPQGAPEHLLAAAVLCFPAHWTLAEKIGRPMMAIHAPVEAYDAGLGIRVQRLLDGVQVGRPLWRFNRLYDDQPELFQPRSEAAPRQGMAHQVDKPFCRAERQTLLRLPDSQWVAFAIQTYVIRSKDVV